MESQLDRIERKLDELLSKKKRKPKQHMVDATIYDEFERWWTVYPKKKGKQDALKAFNSIAIPLGAIYAPAFTDKIIQDTRDRIRQEESWLTGNGKYVPLPATYLRGERWNDDITKAEVVAKQPEIFSQAFKTFDPDKRGDADLDTSTNPYGDMT